MAKNKNLLNTDFISRREALKITLLTAAGLTLAGGRPLSAAEKTPAGKLQLGVASFSLLKYSLDELIDALHKLEITNVSLFKAHCPWDGAQEACAAIGKKIRDAGLTLTGTGVIYLHNNEDEIRTAFENTKAAGVPTMVCSPQRDALPLINKFVKEYDNIRLAIHNHGPEDVVYPSPYDVWKAIQPYDERIGMCLDVGHAARSGVDPVEVIHTCKTRLYDLHLKDSVALAGETFDLPMEVGRGHLNIKGILAALIEVGYFHIVAFEYEKPSGDRFAGLQASINFVRQTLSQLAG